MVSVNLAGWNVQKHPGFALAMWAKGHNRRNRSVGSLWPDAMALAAKRRAKAAGAKASAPPVRARRASVREKRRSDALRSPCFREAKVALTLEGQGQGARSAIPFCKLSCPGGKSAIGARCLTEAVW